jgi:uncharacterized protein YacL (UPF0231 family)
MSNCYKIKLSYNVQLEGVWYNECVMTDLSKAKIIYTEPSLLKGAARTASIVNTLDKFSVSATEEEADYKALSNDWKIVGQHLKNAVKDYAKQQKKK